VVHARRGIILACGRHQHAGPPAALEGRHQQRPRGKRTFLHPLVPIAAFYDEPIEGFYGAPQIGLRAALRRSRRRRRLLSRDGATQPMLTAIAFPGAGDAHRRLMERLPHVQGDDRAARRRHHDDAGGTVAVDGAGRIKLRYPLTPALREAAVHALQSMARLQLAAARASSSRCNDTPITIRNERTSRASPDVPFGATFTRSSRPTRWGAVHGDDPPPPS